MKKLLLWLFILYPFLVLNGRQLQNHDLILDTVSADSIFVLKADTSYSTFNNPLQFNSFIQLKVHGLSKLLQLSLEQNKSIQLYLDGIEMKGIAPLGIDKSKEVLFFILHRDALSMKQWRIVKQIVLEKKKKELVASVGLRGEKAFPSTVFLPAELSRSGDYYLAVLSGSFLIILFSFLVTRSNTLRNNLQIPTDAFSLSKALITFWVFIILFSILFLLASINSMPQITKSVILLFIISVFTTLAAKVIGFLKYKGTSPVTVSSINFFRDIISDSSGINIYRLQLILFTILTGSYFVVTVVSEMNLPAFDIYFLVLYSISHFIYLFSKCFVNTNRL